MTGVLGAVRPRGGALAAVSRASNRVAGGHPDRGDRAQDAGDTWAFEFRSPGILGDSMTTSPVVLAFRGDVHNESALRQQAGRPDGPLAAVLATLYERDGARFVASLEGAFAIAVIDPRSQRVLLASDALGTYPIYWHAGDQGLSFASSLTGLLGTFDGPPALSLRAVADYLTIGFVTGDRTLAANVSLLGPGSVLTHDWDSGRTELRRYHETAEFFGGERLEKSAYVERVAEAFASAVTRSLSGRRQFGLSLSGGLDSRAVLSAINGHHEGSIISYTVGVAGCADQAIARQLSALSGTDHRFFALNDGYLKDFLPNQARMVALTDGQYLSHGLTEVLVLQFLADTGIEILLRGHGGELAKMSLAWPLHTDERIHAMTDRQAFVDYLAARASYVAGGVSVADLLTPAAASLAGRGAADSLHELLDDVPLSPAELCGYVYLREHHRRFTVPSLELFRTVTEIRMPFVDREFLVALFAGDPRWRDDTSLHRALTAHGDRRLLRIRNSNTGAPGDAGPLVERVLDKFNSLLKRLNVPGYRHYHDFDRWLRTMLLESVERELLSPSARTAAFVRPEALRRLLDETRRGAADRGYLLQVLLIVELWQREHGVHEVAE